MAMDPTPEQIEELVTGPDEGPVVMLQLLRWRRGPGGEVPREAQIAYARYADGIREVLKSIGGRFLWVGRVDSTVIGELAEPFDLVGLVEYPSRRAFLDWTQDPRVAALGEKREAGLEAQWMVATTETEISGLVRIG